MKLELDLNTMTSQQLGWAVQTIDAYRAMRDGFTRPTTEHDAEERRVMQLSAIISAAFGYWKEGDAIHPDYDSTALRDVAKLYAKYDNLYRTAQPEVAQNTGSSEPAPPFTGDPAGRPTGSTSSEREIAVEGSGTSSTATAVTEQKRGRGRPRKETAQESTAPAVEEQAPAEPAQESAQPITIDQLRAALQTFTAKNGIEAGMPLLAKYNARRISEMVEQSEADKAAFIKECSGAGV